MIATEPLGTTRDVFVVARPRDRTAYAASPDEGLAERYSRETGFPIEV